MAVDTRARDLTLDQLVTLSPYFQRAVHLRYDRGNAEAIARYIPTTSSANALTSILRATEPGTSQRAHVLHAAYGSGKSLLAVVLTALLEKRETLEPALSQFLQRARKSQPELGNLLDKYQVEDTRLLPVLLVGDEGDFATALSRALSRSLDEAGLNLEAKTRFSAALDVLSLWKSDYPDAYEYLARLLREEARQTPEDFERELLFQNADTFELFEELYPRLTAGARFDQFFGQTPELIYREVVEQLKNHGYNGIVVIWDEFGRYLEARTAKAFGKEAALLQSFAEACNYSDDEQLHLIVLAHKELQSYASALPKAYQQEWARIEGRFQRHNVTSDPQVAYQLVGSAVNPIDEFSVAIEVDERTEQQLIQNSMDTRLFGFLSSSDIRQLIYDTWPLHPLSAYALIRLSSRVAQNERTMFTFLTVDERHALLDSLRGISMSDGDPWIRPGQLWDYFEDAVRSDTGIGGAHQVWSGVIHALDKVPAGDHFSEMLIKTLGVLTISTEAGVARPTTDLLCWAVGAESTDQRAAVVQTLENLRRRKVVIHRQIDGYWTFTSGSDIDFERRLREILERTNPSSIQLRRLLQQVAPAPYTLARRYNQERSMTRYFTGLYRWPEDLVDAPWDALIQRLHNTDGLVVYVLAGDDLGRQQALEALELHDRVIYVLPKEPLLALEDTLRELFGLYELNADPTLKQQEDRERIQREIDWLIEDVEARLQREIERLTDPRQGEAVWYYSAGEEILHESLTAPGQATRVVSRICERVFSRTPEFNNEGLNKRKPTAQQVRAAETAIDAMFIDEPAPRLNIEGRGPDVLAVNTILDLPGILREEGVNWVIARPPNNEYLAEVWDQIEGYLDNCNIEGGAPIKPLIDELTAPPYGVRPGVIPLLLAAVLRGRIKATTIRRDHRPVYPIDGELLTDLVKDAERYSVEVGHWSEALERLWDAVMSRFESHIHETERRQEPLSMFKTAMLRWLQALPPYCRDTRQLSDEALHLRNLVRVAQHEPARVLLEELPDLLALDDMATTDELERRLDSYLAEISNAYLELQRRLDLFVLREFGNFDGAGGGVSALRAWLEQVQQNFETDMSELRFSSPRTQALVNTILSFNGDDSLFWNALSQAVTGVSIRDWTDQSEERFCQALLDARAEIEVQTKDLLDETSVVSVALQLPHDGHTQYRFREASLSNQGARILQNFKSTFEIAGRPLSVDEKRQIAIEFLRYVMGDASDHG